MQFFEVIEYLSAQLNLSQLVPRPDGTCAVRLDDVIVHLTHDPLARCFDIRSDIGHADTGDAALMKELLAANRFGDGGAGVLGCDAMGHTVLRQRFSLQDLSLHRFYTGLARFVSHAEHWQARLAAGVRA
ncbi:MAG: type III secretion system chaperone [Pseudomonadota bacterium]